MMDRSLIGQVMAVSGMAALAFVLLSAEGPFVLTLAALTVAVVAVAGLIGLVRVVVVSERERERVRR
jgi:Flp pilus assembly protein TadB